MNTSKWNVSGSKELESRLAEMIEGRFGKDLKVLSYFSSHYHSDEDDIIIPINKENVAIAKVVVFGGKDLDPREQSEIESLVQIYSRNLTLVFDETETPHKIDETAELQTGDAEELYPKSDLWIDADDLQLSDIDFLSDMEPQPFEFVNHGFVIKTGNDRLFTKISYVLHEKTDRWALLRWDDVRDSIKSIHDLLSMGTTTLVVKDPSRLSQREQELIRVCLSLNSVQEKPIFVFHDTSDGGQGIQFLEDIPVSLISANRLPQDENLLSEALDLMVRA